MIFRGINLLMKIFSQNKAILKVFQLPCLLRLSLCMGYDDYNIFEQMQGSLVCLHRKLTKSYCIYNSQHNNTCINQIIFTDNCGEKHVIEIEPGFYIFPDLDISLQERETLFNKFQLVRNLRTKKINKGDEKSMKRLAEAELFIIEALNNPRSKEKQGIEDVEGGSFNREMIDQDNIETEDSLLRKKEADDVYQAIRSEALARRNIIFKEQETKRTNTIMEVNLLNTSAEEEYIKSKEIADSDYENASNKKWELFNRAFTFQDSELRKATFEESDKVLRDGKANHSFALKEAINQREIKLNLAKKLLTTVFNETDLARKQAEDELKKEFERAEICRDRILKNLDSLSKEDKQGQSNINYTILNNNNSEKRKHSLDIHGCNAVMEHQKNFSEDEIDNSCPNSTNSITSHFSMIDVSGDLEVYEDSILTNCMSSSLRGNEINDPEIITCSEVEKKTSRKNGGKNSKNTSKRLKKNLNKEIIDAEEDSLRNQTDTPNKDHETKNHFSEEQIVDPEKIGDELARMRENLGKINEIFNF